MIFDGEKIAGGMEHMVREMRTWAEEETSWDFQKRN
jgi:hypothetical protein